MQNYPTVNSSYQPTTDPSGWRNNPNYKVTIYNNDTSVNLGQNFVQAYIPENFHFRVQNQWEPFLASLDNTGSVIDSINHYSNVVGLNLNYKLLSTLVWHRMEPIEFAFQFLFDSHNSALLDVTIPVMNLVAMATPTRGQDYLGSFVLTAPGPTVGNPTKNISMKVGRFFYIDSVVFDSLDITWHTAAEGSGDFIAADVDVSLRGWYSPDQNDIFTYFGLGDSGVANYIKSNPQDFSDFANTANGGGAPLIYDTTAGARDFANYLKEKARNLTSYSGVNPSPIPGP